MAEKVYFIGAGPGDPDLVTVKGRALIQRAGLVLYAGSLVPRQLVACAPPDAEVVDSAPLDLETIVALMVAAARQGRLVARVHTGDPTLFGALLEQTRALDRAGIEYEVVPGVSALFAAAAAAKISFTAPERAQSVVITRAPGRTPVPQGQEPAAYAVHGAPMAIYLSGQTPDEVARSLLQAGMPPDTAVLLAHRVSQPEQRLIWSTLAGMAAAVQGQELSRQTLFLVLPECGDAPRSLLYDARQGHGFREAAPEQDTAGSGQEPT